MKNQSNGAMLLLKFCFRKTKDRRAEGVFDLGSQFFGAVGKMQKNYDSNDHVATIESNE